MSTPITLYQLQQSIKESLTQRFPLAVWVAAEISELKVNYSGHCYLELVDKGEGERLPRAQSRAVIWRNNYTALSSYFCKECGQQLAAGIKVLVKVHVNFHELYGMSLQITDIDPSYTIGDAERERQRTIAQLQKDGVWDMNREQPLPNLIQKIAIISSANAAGYQDFYQEVARSGYYFSLTLFDAFMQGAGAEESVVAALEAVAKSDKEFDAVVIIRGGGSVNDLRCFDGYRVASHVAQFPLPIVSGIGHDKDISVVDMVSALSLKTPTAVATWLVERMLTLDAWLDSAALSLHDSAVVITRNHEIALERLSSDLKARAQQLIESARFNLESAEKLIPDLSKQLLTLHQSRLAGYEAAVELHSPEHLLKLGYAVARIGDTVLRTAQQVNVGENITLEIADACISAQIIDIESKKL